MNGTMTISAGNSNVLFKTANKKPLVLLDFQPSKIYCCYEVIKAFFRVELGTSNGGGTVNGRADVRDIFELPSQNDYDEEDQYNRVNTTGLFAAGGFGQRIFFRQNTAILSQMEAIGDSADNKGGFLQKGRKLK